MCGDPSISTEIYQGLKSPGILGALMNLGIERDVLGDIIVRDSVGYVFCEDAMAAYLADNITQVRHTVMTTEVIKNVRQAAPQFLEEICRQFQPL